MWSMATNAIRLFMQGRLFRESGKVFRQVLIGAVFTAIIMAAAAAALAFAGLGLEAAWIASGIAGFLGGMLQPYLFKDLKYA